MKKTLVLAVIVISATGLFSCGQKSTQPAEQPNAASSPSGYIPIDPAQLKEQGQIVPASTAKAWRNNYENAVTELYWYDPASKKYTPTTNAPKSFIFRTTDLLAALGVSGAPSTPHIRGYLGIDSAGNMKMYFVGVEGAQLDGSAKQAGKDVYFSIKGSGSELKDGEGYALDLNYPCPILCPPPPDRTAMTKTVLK